jgi:cell division protein FtsW
MEKKRSIYSFYYEWWKNIDKFIFFIIILLFVTGLFFSLVSTSLIVSDKLETNDYTFFFKHLLFVFLGIIIIFLLSSINEAKLFKFSPIIFMFSLISLLLVPIIGVEVNSAQRWIDLYFLPRFQPIELVKPFLIISISLILSSKKYTNIYLKYLLSFFITLVIAILLAAQPDIGQTLLIFFSWSLLIFVSGINIVFLAVSSSVLFIILFFSIMLFPKFEYIKNRIISFFNTETGTHNAQS